MAKQKARLGGSAVILVVERDPHVRDLEGFFLERAGYSVEFASDGDSALALVREVRPALVITEVLVPGLDGLSVCRRIKGDAELEGTKVLVFSILAVGSRAEEAGADAFLLKPLAERLLVETVRELMSLGEEGAG
ncbi:MAG TPA: response regulator [Longimicrobiales bacterium]|nr:response regulator [Longimicrobiales bacterium]